MFSGRLCSALARVLEDPEPWTDIVVSASGVHVLCGRCVRHMSVCRASRAAHSIGHALRVGLRSICECHVVWELYVGRLRVCVCGSHVETHPAQASIHTPNNMISQSRACRHVRERVAARLAGAYMCHVLVDVFQELPCDTSVATKGAEFCKLYIRLLVCRGDVPS